MDTPLIRLTCPHFVIRGAVGGDKQIGHVVVPSSRRAADPLADAEAEERGTMICKISCHWKKLQKQGKVGNDKQ